MEFRDMLLEQINRANEMRSQNQNQSLFNRCVETLILVCPECIKKEAQEKQKEYGANSENCFKPDAWEKVFSFCVSQLVKDGYI